MSSCLIPVKPSGSKCPFFYVHGADGYTIDSLLSQYIDPERPFYGLRALGRDGKEKPHTSVEEMAAYYIQEIQTVQPEGPYLLGGRCTGGIIALEMAQQLKKKSEDVLLVVMVDSPRRLVTEAEKSEYQTVVLKWKERWKHDFLSESSTQLSSEVFHHNILIPVNYKLQQYSGAVVYFAAQDTGENSYFTPDKWNEIVDSFKSYEVSGNQLSITKEPNIRILASELSRCLDEAELITQSNSQNVNQPSFKQKTRHRSMGKNNVPEIYDEAYAQEYNQRFLLNDWFASDVEFERETIGKLLSEIGEDARWLDVACGTGYFLSCFPEVDRAGLDISPAMLKVARQENPGVLFVEGNFKDKRPQWKDKWDVVSCMWEAYMYVESLPQLERVVENLAEWVSKRGICFLPICDPRKLGSGEIKLPDMNQNLDLNGGDIRFEAVTWSWIEKTEKQHLNMLAPQVKYMVALLSKYFEQVEVVEYPLFKGKQRKAIIARKKKQENTIKDKGENKKLEGQLSLFLRIVRADNWWLYKIPPLMLIAYAATSLIDLSPAQSIQITLALLFSISSLFAYGHIINDIFDVEVDQKVSKSNAMIGQSWWHRFIFCTILIIAGFIFPVALNFGFAASVLLGINYLLPTIYSAPPLRLKEKGIFGVISDAAGAHATPTSFFVTTFLHLNPMLQPEAFVFSVAAIGWAFFVGLRGILLHQLWDRDDDLRSNVKTFVTESDVESVRFWMNRIVFPTELLLLSALILVISHSAPLILVFTIVYFLLKIILFKADPIATFDPAPTQKAYVIPHDFYEIGLPLILATSLSLQNPWFALLLLLQVTLFYPGIERRVTNLVQSLRGKPQDLNSLQAQLTISQTELAKLNSRLQQTQTQLEQAQTQLQQLQAETQRDRAQTQTALATLQVEITQAQTQLQQLQTETQRDRAQTQTELVNLKEEVAQAESARQALQAEALRLKLYLQTQGLDSLMNYYRHEIATNPDDLSLYYQALEIYPDDAYIHLQLSNALIRQGQFSEAIAQYRTALQFHPGHFELHFELAKALEKNQQWDEAIEAYRRAIDLNPNHSVAHQHLGDALAERGQIHEASLSYRHALQLQ